jgi:hypothetical protein
MKTRSLALFAVAVLTAPIAACSAPRPSSEGREATAQEAQSSTAACTGAWDVVPSPNLGGQDNVLGAVAGESPNDVWAVGLYVRDDQPDFTQTLTQHFDGAAWSVVPSPNAGDQANTLYAVATAGERAFATGYFIDAVRSPRSLIEAWDGTAWTLVDHPHAGHSDWLYSVSAVSASDVWAVGSSRDADGVFRTLTEHFDGRRWVRVPSPNPGENGDQLYGVVARAADDVWAVGQRTGDEGPDRALVLRWDGAEWRVAHTPNEGASSALLYSVSGGSGSELTTVGASSTDEGSRTLAAVARHRRWGVEPSADVGAGDNFLYSVSAAVGATTWALGTYLDPASGNDFTLVEQSTAKGWAQVTSPSPSSNGNNILGGVARVGAHDVWAVGTFDGANARQTLTLHHCE